MTLTDPIWITLAVLLIGLLWKRSVDTRPGRFQLVLVPKMSEEVTGKNGPGYWVLNTVTGELWIPVYDGAGAVNWIPYPKPGEDKPVLC